MKLHPIQLLHGDCLKQIPLLENRSIWAVITSPPYAQQRKGEYPGWDEKEYPATMVRIFEAITPKLSEDGSILVNIRSHVKDGAVSDYVLKTRLALRESGWIENEELIWYKPNSDPKGSIHRPRRSWENILWFSMSKKPFVNLKAAGKLSGNIGGFKGRKRASGIARITDVFFAGTAENAKKVKHPAKFPPSLVEQLVHTFTEKDDGVPGT